MEFLSSSQPSLDDDVYDADDFDLDFDDDYEFLSDEEFEVYIEEEEYELNDLTMPGGLCLDDDTDAFGKYDSLEEGLPEKDYEEKAP